ncbi:MAG: PAS domain-containing protein [Candidatus Aminicenantes bacterium]|nr:PAS domain-containing protein [Candidatus Aminicenantes bacterium]
MTQAQKIIHKHTLYRISLSILFGLIGFAVNFINIQLLESDTFKVNILLGLIFPLIIALAWGWRYGLLSALAGGCQSMWWLWRSDGYGFLYAVPVFTLWIVWHGYWANRRAQQDKYPWYYSVFIIEIPFRIIIELGFFTIFRWLVSQNPPPWDQSITWNHVSKDWVFLVSIKHTISAYLLLLSAYVLLHLSPVRQLFRLKKLPVAHTINAVYAFSLLMGFALWSIDSIVDYYVFNYQNQTFWEIAIIDTDSHVLFMRYLYFIITLIAGVLVVRILRERQRIASKLAENYALLQIAGETARFGGWSVDLGKKICAWSDAVADIHEVPYGYAPPVQEGIKFYAHEWHDRITKVFTDCAEKGIPYDEEMEIITKTGKRVWVRTIGKPVKDENGKIVKVEGSFQDISKRKQTEKELIQLKDNLEKEVAEKTRELKERILELERFHDATINREIRMNELREEIERLKRERVTM